MRRKQIDYSQEVKNLLETVRRISKAHDVALDMILHDVELSLIEDKAFTREKYLGIYKAIPNGPQSRLTLPKGYPIHEAYYLYITEWQDFIARPVRAPGKSARAPIIEAP